MTLHTEAGVFRDTAEEITQIPEEFQTIVEELREEHGSAPSSEVIILRSLRYIDEQERRIDRAKERKAIWTRMLGMEIDLCEGGIAHAKGNIRVLLKDMGESSWKSPEGKITLVRQQPAWLWPDDEELLDELRKTENESFIKSKEVFTPDKKGIKEAGLALECVEIDPRHERRVDVQTPYYYEKKEKEKAAKEAKTK